MQIGVKNQKSNNYREVMTRVVKAALEGKLESTIDDMPKQIVPDGSQPKYYSSLEAGMINFLVYCYEN